MITTYAELKAEIIRWVDREDPDFIGQVPLFVKLAETRMYRGLRTRENEFNKQWTAADAPLSPLLLPQNFREIKTLNLDGRALENISPLHFRNRQARGNGGITQYFTMIGRQLEILDWPTETPDDWGSFTLELIYYGTESIVEMATWDTPTNPNSDFESPGTPPITEIRGDNATSRLLQVAPDAYLYGSLVPAFRYLRDLQKAQEADAEFLRTMGEIQMEYADADLTGSPLTIASIYDEGGRY